MKAPGIFALAVMSLFVICPPASTETTGCVMTAGGTPVAGAEIRLVALESAAQRMQRHAAGEPRTALDKATSDEAGGFTLISDIGTGREILIDAEGFAPAAVRPSGQVVGCVIEPAAMVDGLVTRERGGPVAGAIVVWLGQNGAEWSQVTDDAGRYSVPDPDVWADHAIAFHPELGLASNASHRIDSRMPSGHRTDIEMPMFEKVAGTVFGPVGDPVEGASISAAGWPLAVTDAEGGFVAAVASGEVLTASKGGLVAQIKVDSRSLKLSLAPGRWISGRTVDAVAGTPVTSVRVFAWDWAGAQTSRDTIVDASGKFELGPLPPSEYRVGAMSTADPWPVGFEEADLNHEQRVELELEVTLTGHVSGRVVDQHGNPVAGAMVTSLAESEPVVLGRTRTSESRLTFSACDGRFAVPVSAGKGKVRLAAVAEGFAPTVSSWIEVPAGAAPVELTMTSGRALEGVVTDRDGHPLTDVQIAVIEGSRMARGLPAAELFSPVTGVQWMYETGQDGRFEIPLNEGDWMVAFGKDGYVPVKRPDVRVDDATEVLDIVLDPAVLVRGRVVDTAGEPIGFAALSIGLEDGEAGIVTSDSEGFFEIQAPRAGRFTLFVFDSDSERRAAVPVEAPASGVVVELAVAMRISGRLVDGDTGEPVVGATVTSRGVGRPSEHFGYSQSELDGSFAIDVHEPGAYELEVRAEGFVDPEPVEVAVDGGDEPVGITVELRRGLLVSGRVVDPEGDPVAAAAAEATLTTDSGREITVRDSSDSDGRFQLQGLMAGTVEISLEAEGFVPSSRTLELDGDAYDLKVELDPGARLAGRVIDADGDPLSDVGIEARASGQRAQTVSASTDEDGTFNLQGMGPGPWGVTARLEGYEELSIEDLDPELRSSVTFVLTEFASGTVVGSIKGVDDSAMVSVSVDTEERSAWRSAHGEMGDDGSYRIEKAPAGPARVTAMEYGYRARRSRVESVVIPENAELRVDFDFAGGAELLGRVTRHGEPVPGALVNASSSVYGDADSVSGTDGYYRCQVANGRFELSVSTIGGTHREYEVDVEGPTTFDVELGGAALIGRVIDGETGRPIAGAEVRAELQSGAAGSLGSDDLTTDSSGSFRFDDLPVGRHVVRVAHPRYVQQRRDVDIVSGSVGEIDVVLEKAEGMRVFLVDARTGAPLSGTVVARNMSNEVVFDGNPRKDGAGVRLLLSPGTYKVSASATGHATHTEIADAPSDEVVIRLTRGGTLIVRATEPAPRDAKLIMPSGEEYIRCWCNRVAEIRLEGTITGIENVAAGSYDLAVTERGGTVSRYPVTVIEDQAVEVLID